MSVPVPLPIAATRVVIEREELAELARTAAERRRRRVVRLIDLAIGQCEAANLAAAGPGKASVLARPSAPVPARAAALLLWLQLEAGEQLRRPFRAAEALDELFRLQVPYLLCGDDDDDDQVADVAVSAQ